MYTPGEKCPADQSGADALVQSSTATYVSKALEVKQERQANRQTSANGRGVMSRGRLMAEDDK
jgi:hypothetical protein